MLKGGDVLFERYISELFKFTTNSFKSTSTSVLFHAGQLNRLWHRVFLESMGLGLPIKEHLSDLMRQIAEAYLDGNLQLKSRQILKVAAFETQASSESDDEDENFEKGQKTQK